ncbi:MAG: hypothetical protein QXQ75_07955 [Candidatus Nitrosocaldaceae archaeon]
MLSLLSKALRKGILLSLDVYERKLTMLIRRNKQLAIVLGL